MKTEYRTHDWYVDQYFAQSPLPTYAMRYALEFLSLTLIGCFLKQKKTLAEKASQTSLEFASPSLVIAKKNITYP